MTSHICSVSETSLYILYLSVIYTLLMSVPGNPRTRLIVERTRLWITTGQPDLSMGSFFKRINLFRPKGQE
jgi:hypothetical protein